MENHKIRFVFLKVEGERWRHARRWIKDCESEDKGDQIDFYSSRCEI